MKSQPCPGTQAQRWGTPPSSLLHAASPGLSPSTSCSVLYLVSRGRARRRHMDTVCQHGRNSFAQRQALCPKREREEVKLFHSQLTRCNQWGPPWKVTRVAAMRGGRHTGSQPLPVRLEPAGMTNGGSDFSRPSSQREGAFRTVRRGRLWRRQL